MAWATSDRASRLPPDWPKIKARVKARAAGRCQAATHAPHCDGIGAEADHITPGDDHNLANLQWLSAPCHKAKTRSETIARNKSIAALRKRPAPPHPGSVQR